MEQFTIPAYNLSKAEGLVAKLNKKAAKAGGTPIVLNVIETFERKVPVGDMDPYFWPTLAFVKFELQCEIIKIAGWTFLGTLDHYSIPGSVIVHTVPGKQIPEQFFKSAATCGHCNYIRKRTETFVLQHDDGSYKQVGRQCLGEFLGIDPAAAISSLSSLRKLYESFSEDDLREIGSGIRELDRYNVAVILAMTATITRKVGYVSRKIAEETGKRPTSDMVRYLLNPPHGSSEAYNHWHQTFEEFKPTDADKKTAADALTWLKEQRASNEFMHNVIQIAKEDFVTYKLIAFAASIIPVYLRAAQSSQSTQIVDGYLGNPGDKLTAKVTIVGLRGFEGRYGYCTAINMVTEAGYRLTWFASGREERFEINRQYDIAFTVSKWDNYQGKKQTIINYVKEI